MRPVALTGARIDTPDDAPAQEKACVPDETFSSFFEARSRWTTDFLDYCRQARTADFAAYAYFLLPTEGSTTMPASSSGAATHEPQSFLWDAEAVTASNGVQLTDDVGIRTYVTARAHGPSRGSSRIDEDQLQIGPSHGCVDCNDRSGPGLECLFRAYQRARSWHAAAKADTSLCRFFTLICSDATRNAYHAFRVSITTGSERLRTSDDYLNFAALAGRRGRVGGRKLRRRGLHEDISIR